MEWTPLKILVFAIAVLALLYAFTFFTFKKAADPIAILDNQLKLAQTSLGKFNVQENLSFKPDSSFAGTTFDLENRSISFNCNNISRCCENGINCDKTIQWSERNITVKNSIPLKTSARCELQYGLFACRLYFGNAPAQIELAKVSSLKQIDLKDSKNADISIELTNSGELPLHLAKIEAKLFQQELVNGIPEKKTIEEKTGEIGTILPQEKKSKKISFNISGDGNFLIELKAFADEAGFAEKKIYFNAIDSTESTCSVDGKDDEIVWNSESLNCKQKYYCKSCQFAFECRDLWEKQLNTDLNSWDSNYSYLTLPCDNPETSQLSPEEQGLLTNSGKTLDIGNKTIVLDPGHGPKSKATGNGCSTSRPYINGITEPEISTDIAIRLKQLLEAQNVKVLLSRNSNENPGCSARSNVANSNNADLFVSIHENAGNGTGSESYYYNGGTNASSNKKLASSIEQQLVKATGLKSRGVKLDTQSQYKTGLGVLRNSKMPAMLVETAFIDGDNAKLQNKEFLQKIAQGIFNGILAYYGGNLTGTTVSGNACQKKVMETAMKQLGKPYYWGATGPNLFDCSGFVYYAYKASGLGSSYGGRGTANSNARSKGIIVDGNPGIGKAAVPNFSKLQPGDIIFFNAQRGVGHTGIYIGNGQFIQSSGGRRCSGKPIGSTCQVKISKLGSGGNLIYNGARRVC